MTSAIQLEAQSASVVLEISASKVTGGSRFLADGMQMDALFFRRVAETDGATKRDLLLTLRGVEICKSGSNIPDTYPIAVSLCLTSEQAQSVYALPPATVELQATPNPKDKRGAAPPQNVRAQPHTAVRTRRDDPIYGVDPYAAQGAENNQWFFRVNPHGAFSSAILKYLLWPIVGIVIFKVAAGTLRGAIRSRRIVPEKGRRTPS